MQTDREEIIKDYLIAYNNFDVKGMLSHMHPDIEFSNINNGVTDLSIKGLDAFREQAKLATRLFESRNQHVTAISKFEDRMEVEINYTGKLKVDLPNGMKKGDRIELKGKSVFRFSGDKIVGLTDIS